MIGEGRTTVTNDVESVPELSAEKRCGRFGNHVEGYQRRIEQDAHKR
jgi:hypothetical protein